MDHAAVASKIKMHTRIIIDKTGNPAAPGKALPVSKGPIVWLIVNQDTNPHTITINPASFIDRATSQPYNPLTTNTPISVPVGGKDFNFLRADIKPGLGGRIFKYEFEKDGVVVHFRGIDPDLDVVDPGQ